MNSGAKNVSFYVKKFEKALKSKKICRVIISRSGMQNTNVRCIISNFELIDKGGEPGDQYYKVDFKEYRSYDPEIVSITTVPSEDTGQTESGQTTAETGTDTTRPVDTPVLRVGASVTVNGEYCYDSNGGKPHGSANNLNTTVTRIVIRKSLSGACGNIWLGTGKPAADHGVKEDGKIIISTDERKSPGRI